VEAAFVPGKPNGSSPRPSRLYALLLHPRWDGLVYVCRPERSSRRNLVARRALQATMASNNRESDGSGSESTPVKAGRSARQRAVKGTSQAKRRPVPADAFALARSKWLRGERLDIGQIAQELGVGRATLFRWVGTREQLYGAVLSEVYERQRRILVRQATGTGVDYVLDVIRRNLEGLLQATPLRTFIEQDPEYAIRVLTSKSSALQARAITLDAELIQSVVDRGEIQPALDIDTLSYIIVRIGESFLYADVISGRAPDIDKAVATIRILLSARAEPPARTESGADPSGLTK
jgi:AcrR family transcriptional regulator